MDELNRAGVKKLPGYKHWSVWGIHLIPNNRGMVVCHVHADLVSPAGRRCDIKKGKPVSGLDGVKRGN